MCTTDLRDEIIAEILVAHVRMPRRYAHWLVSQTTDDERSYLTKAALKNRRAHVAAKQRQIHERLAASRCFPENILAIGPADSEPQPRAATRRQRRKTDDFPRLFSV